jgi:hypothetical protein
MYLGGPLRLKLLDSHTYALLKCSKLCLDTGGRIKLWPYDINNIQPAYAVYFPIEKEAPRGSKKEFMSLFILSKAGY